MHPLAVSQPSKATRRITQTYLTKDIKMVAVPPHPVNMAEDTNPWSDQSLGRSRGLPIKSVFGSPGSGGAEGQFLALLVTGSGSGSKSQPLTGRRKMEWLIFFVKRLLTMWTIEDASRPGLARQYAPLTSAAGRRCVEQCGKAVLMGLSRRGPTPGILLRRHGRAAYHARPKVRRMDDSPRAA